MIRVNKNSLINSAYYTFHDFFTLSWRWNFLHFRFWENSGLRHFLSFLYHNITLLVMIASGYLLTRLLAAALWKTVYSNEGAKRREWVPFYSRERARRDKWFSHKLFYLIFGRSIERRRKMKILFFSFIFFEFIMVTLLTNKVSKEYCEAINWMTCTRADRLFL